MERLILPQGTSTFNNGQQVYGQGAGAANQNEDNSMDSQGLRRRDSDPLFNMDEEHIEND